MLDAKDRATVTKDTLGHPLRQKEQLVRELKLFANISNASIRKIEQILNWHNFAKGETILNEHDTSDDVYFIVEGKVSILGYALSGQVISYASLETGEYFGELAAIDKKPRSATVIANEASLVAVLPGEEFRQLIKLNSEVAYMIMKKLTRIIRQSNLNVSNINALGLKERVCLELLRLADPPSIDSNYCKINPLPTQQQMAAKMGSTRESIGRILSQLSHTGIIHRKSRVLHVPDMKKLEEIIMPGNFKSIYDHLDRENSHTSRYEDKDRRGQGSRRNVDRRRTN